MKKILLTLTILIGFAGSAFALPYMAADGHIDVVLNGTDHSDVSAVAPRYTSGMSTAWFEKSDSTLVTFWAGPWVEYTTTLSAGSWNIGLDVSNYSSIYDITEEWYSEFVVTAKLDTSAEDIIIRIPASSTEVHNGYFNTDLSAGEYTVRYQWLNDKYNPAAGYDANIKIHDVFFDKISPVIPEPTTMAILGLGSLGLLTFKRKQ